MNISTSMTRTMSATLLELYQSNVTMQYKKITYEKGWTRSQKSAYITNLLNNHLSQQSLNLTFVTRNDRTATLCLDGNERLLAIRHFMNNTNSKTRLTVRLGKDKVVYNEESAGNGYRVMTDEEVEAFHNIEFTVKSHVFETNLKSKNNVNDYANDDANDNNNSNSSSDNSSDNSSDSSSDNGGCENGCNKKRRRDEL